ncbi:MAG TPA: glycoside hydrolase family 3 C-terminal domain-containing protein [Acidobacteriaceae bacterium]
MKKFVALLILASGAVLCARAARAQEAIEYQLCGLDFRPISMHSDLPAHAVYADRKASAEERAQDVVRRLSFAEKLTLTGGLMQMHYPGVARLGIPPVYFSDATQGIHVKNICVKVGKTTAFPSGQALAATWDPGLAYRYAQSISEESQAYGINVILGPGLNMYRNSEGGRNFEYFGEDPYLTSQIGVSYVKGMQSLGTIATVKHFLGNEQEVVRHDANAIIGERALHEIYLAPFKAAIEQGGVLAVMTGNNLVNGYPGAADTPLSLDILRDKYGYKGIIMSDWANSMYWPHRQELELTSGHSLLMSDNDLFAKYVTDEIAAHPEKKTAIEKDLDAMVLANLYSFFKSGVYDRPYRAPALTEKIDSHKKIALETAEDGITLLKNDGNLLPLRPEKVKKLVLVGTDQALEVYGGLGSGAVVGYDHVDFMAGLKSTYGDRVVRLTADDEDEIKSADAVLYFISKKAGEGSDVPYDLPGVEDNINKYAGLNKNLIVIFSGGNGFPMPWLPKVKAMVFAYLLGQERGTALADILSGKVDPSGKLPFSIEKTFTDSPAYDYNKLPDGTYYWGGGKPNSKLIQEKFGTFDIKYKEGIYIGYRWFDKEHIAPLFPFGYGLSYTTFAYAPLRPSSSKLSDAKAVTIRFSITNTGDRDGAEVAQLYVHDLGSPADRPVKELKGFEKVFLKAGETKTVALPVTVKDLAYWNDKTHGWQSDHGRYEIEVGSSSADIRQRTVVRY